MSQPLAIAGSVLVLAIWPSAATAQEAASQEVQQEMQRGAQAMSAGDFGAAVQAYSAVTKARPEFAEGNFNLGLALEQADRIPEARAALQNALRLKPELRGANLFLGIAEYRLNRTNEAIAALERETRIDPKNAKAYMWLGICRLADDDAQGAIAPLDKAYALDPKDVDILYHRGHAYMQVANASYAAMYRIDPDSVRVHEVLADAYARGSRTADAISEYELAVRTAPSHPGLHEELGDQYWESGELQKAAEAYRRELEIDPYAVTSMYKLGSLLVTNWDAEAGVELLRRALKTDPAFHDAHYYLGIGLVRLNHPREAIPEFEQVIAADPTADHTKTSYYKLTLIYRGLHEPEQEKNALNNFLRMRADAKQKLDTRAAERVRRRDELPVDPEASTASSSGAAQAASP
ncbi:MAG: tetratricopeptide repeat protein [Terracidiphilus sp.]